MKVAILFAFEYEGCMPKWSRLDGVICDLYTVYHHARDVMGCRDILIVTDNTTKNLSEVIYSLVVSGDVSPAVITFMEDYADHIIYWDSAGQWLHRSKVKRVLDNASMLFLYYSGHGHNSHLVIPHYRHNACYDDPCTVATFTPSQLASPVIHSTRKHVPVVAVFDCCECDGILAPFSTDALGVRYHGMDDYDIYDGRFLWSVVCSTVNGYTHSSAKGSRFTRSWFDLTSYDNNAQIPLFEASVRVSHPCLTLLPLWFVSKAMSDLHIIDSRVTLTRYSNNAQLFFIDETNKDEK